MSYYGDIRLGDTIDIKFTTRRFTTGAPFTLAGTPTVAAYPGNSTTEITAGITLTVDFDARTGLNNVRVVASGANGYATATNYVLVVTAGTVDAVSVVGEVVGSFSIENRSALMPTTAGRTLLVEADGMAQADMREVGGTLQTAGDIIGDTNDIQARLPAALVSGRMDSSVGAMAADVVTATAIQNGALTAAKAAAGFFDAVWTVATRTLTAFSTALALSVWDVLESAIGTASSIGLKLKNNLDAAISTRATPAQVNTEMLNVVNVNTFAEPGQEVPPATTTLVKKIGYLYKAWRNKSTKDATSTKLFADDTTTVDQKTADSDDGTTFTKGEVGTGP